MSSETSKTELWALNRRKESNFEHIIKLNRQACSKCKKTKPLHVREMNRNAQNRKRPLVSGLNPGDHDLLQPATKRRNASCTPVNEIQEIECKSSIQEMQKMAKVIEAFNDNSTHYLLW